MKKKQAPSIEGVSPAGPRRYLYFTAAVTGAAIMIIEILGARMLAPYIGTSHFVWTAQIAVTLVALSVGYYAGGWLVDRSPELHRLYICIAIAAAYLCFSTLVVGPVAYACLGFKQGLPVGSLLAATFLFFIPLSLLAMVGPFVIRVLTSDLNRMGSSVGGLIALSTLGSFVGTVLVGYVFIPYLPNSMTMYLTAGVLMVICAVYLLVVARGTEGRATMAVTVLAGMVLAYFVARQARAVHWTQVREIYSGNSNFGQLQVLETLDGVRRFYLNDYLMQNTYDVTQKKSVSMFTYMLHQLAHAYTERLQTALCIGVGVGIVPSQLFRDGVRVDAIEINPAVVPVAEMFFGFEANKTRLEIGDGRQFVNATTNRYDAIILDAFLGDSSPSHLMSREAFQAMQRCLQPGGALVMNVFGDFEPGKDFFIASLHKTLKAVFRNVVIHAAGNGNVFVVGSDHTDFRLRRGPDLDSVHSQCRDQVADAFARTHQPDPVRGIVLTDDYNPLDFYDAANREVMRRQFAINLRTF